MNLQSLGSKLMRLPARSPTKMHRNDHLRHMLFSQIVRYWLRENAGSGLTWVGIREELKPQNLSFTEIAKRVGERWQLLAPEEKEPYESQAGSLKERYSADFAKYKRTSHYKEYIEYLADFKAKNAAASASMGFFLTYIPS